MDQELHMAEDQTTEQHATAEAPENQEADGTPALQAEINELKDQLLRALAEVENVRKRGQIDRENAHKFAVVYH